jgi:hypothetical protein
MSHFQLQRCFASFRIEDVGLSDDEVQSVKHWTKTYMDKYPLVGSLEGGGPCDNSKGSSI